jgi:hypothetical protein
LLVLNAAEPGLAATLLTGAVVLLPMCPFLLLLLLLLLLCSGSK